MTYVKGGFKKSIGYDFINAINCDLSIKEFTDRFLTGAGTGTLTYEDLKINNHRKNRNKMNREQIQKLNEICEANGLKIVSGSDRVFVIEPVDPWEGVMFAEFVAYHTDWGFTKGKIYRTDGTIDLVGNHNFTNDNGDITGIHISYFKPSTPEEYSKQLIQEAKEKYGEIKEGDRFRRDFGCIKQIGTIGEYDVPLTFSYDEKDDSLEFSGTMIYDKGKWAERVEDEKARTGYIKIREDNINIEIVGSKNLMSLDKLYKIRTFINKTLNEKD